MADKMTTTRDAIRDLDSAVNIVKLEGPSEVASAAQKFFKALDNEFDLILETSIIKAGNSSNRLHVEVEGEKFAQVIQSRDKARNEFIDGARDALY